MNDQPNAEWNVAEWHGKLLVDSSGEKIGKLQDVYVDVETYPSFSSINLGMPVTNGAFNSSALGYNPGGPGDIVMLRLYYQYPVFVNLFGFNLSNLKNGTNLFAATAVFKNEPYAPS